jgi:hypothetical protein
VPYHDPNLSEATYRLLLPFMEAGYRYHAQASGQITHLTFPEAPHTSEASLFKLPELSLTSIRVSSEQSLHRVLRQLKATETLATVFVHECDLTVGLAKLLAMLPQLIAVNLEYDGPINATDLGSSVRPGALTQLAKIQSLRDLGLRRAVLDPPQLAELAGSSIESLNLSAIPLCDSDLAHVSTLVRLRGLRLQDTALTGSGFTHLLPLCRLRELHLSGNELTADPWRFLSQMTSLEELYFWDATVDMRSQALIPRLQNLTHLTLENSEVTDETLAFIAQLPKLEYLSVSKSSVTNRGVKMIAKLSQMARLFLNATEITDDALSYMMHLPNLQHLELSETNITDQGCMTLCSLPALTHVAIMETKVRGPGVLRLRETLPDLHIDHGDLPKLVRTKNYVRYCGVYFQVDAQQSMLVANVDPQSQELLLSVNIVCTDDLIPYGTQPAHLTSPPLFWSKGDWRLLTKFRYRQKRCDRAPKDAIAGLYNGEHFIPINSVIRFVARSKNVLHIRWQADVCEYSGDYGPFAKVKVDAPIALKGIVVSNEDGTLDKASARRQAERFFAPAEVGECLGEEHARFEFAFVAID